VINAKTDANQKLIVAAFRKMGASVAMLATVGNGIPDLLVGYRGKNYLVEVKMPGKKLNALQALWHSEWRGQAVIIDSVNAAIDFMRDL
jgi:hypothetical protein